MMDMRADVIHTDRYRGCGAEPMVLAETAFGAKNSGGTVVM
jgi:hypothetical protein